MPCEACEERRRKIMETFDQAFEKIFGAGPDTPKPPPAQEEDRKPTEPPDLP